MDNHLGSSGSQEQVAAAQSGEGAALPQTTRDRFDEISTKARTVRGQAVELAHRAKTERHRFEQQQAKEARLLKAVEPLAIERGLTRADVRALSPEQREDLQARVAAHGARHGTLTGLCGRQARSRTRRTRARGAMCARRITPVQRTSGSRACRLFPVADAPGRRLVVPGGSRPQDPLPRAGTWRPTDVRNGPWQAPEPRPARTCGRDPAHSRQGDLDIRTGRDGRTATGAANLMVGSARAKYWAGQFRAPSGAGTPSTMEDKEPMGDEEFVSDAQAAEDERWLAALPPGRRALVKMMLDRLCEAENDSTHQPRA